jgi:SAM-dependent methyltransferase
LTERHIVGIAADTIPVLTRRIGSWRISVQRHVLPPGELGRRYDAAAPQWDRRLARLGVPAAYETLFRTMLVDAQLDMHGHRHRVLDCGAGTGAASAALLAALGGVPAAGLELTAVDVSRRMLEQAGLKLRRPGLRVTLCHADLRTLPFGDGAFDLAIAAHTLEHAARPDAALRELVRVLAPGGLLLACLTRSSMLGTVVQLKHRTHCTTEAEARSWLLGSGLEDVRCQALGGSFWSRRLSLSCIGRKPRTACAAPHRGAADAIDSARAS